MATYQSLPWRADGDVGVDSNCNEEETEVRTERTHGQTTGVCEDSTTPSFSVFLPASVKRGNVSPISTITKPMDELRRSQLHTDNDRDLRRKRSKNRLWSRASALSTDGWTPEVVGLLVSWASLISAACLFHHVDNTYPSYWMLRFSPSTLVAVLAKSAQVGLAVTIAGCVGQLGWLHFVKRRKRGRRSKKRCVLPFAQRERTSSDHRRLVDLEHFYSASRGPLGATSLLFTVPNAASFLCFATILVSLGFEAALQQCLSVTGPHYIPRVYNLTAANTPSGTNFQQFGDPLRDSIGLTMQAIQALEADSDGFFVSTIDYTLERKGTGSPVYATLGFCPSCEEIGTQSTPDGGREVSLPDGSVASVDSGTLMRLIPMTVQRNHSQSWQGPLSLADFVVVGQLDSLPGETSSHSIGGVDAQHCQIDLCVQVYQLTSSYHEETSFENSLVSFDQAIRSSQTADYNVGWVITPPARLVLSTNRSSLSPFDQFGPTQAVWTSDNYSYSIDDGAFDFLCDYFYSLFNGTAETTALKTDSVVQSPIESAFLQSLIGTDQEAVALSRAVDFRETLRIACKGMEAYIRETYRIFNIKDALDNSFSTYRIRWAWIALPAAVEVLTTVLLVVVIVNSNRVGLPLWKTGILPILLRSAIQVDHEEWEAGDGAKPSVLKEKAGDMHAELRSKESGYLLVEV